MPLHDCLISKIARINFTSVALRLEELIILHSSHLVTVWGHSLKPTPSLLSGDDNNHPHLTAVDPPLCSCDPRGSELIPATHTFIMRLFELLCYSVESKTCPCVLSTVHTVCVIVAVLYLCVLHRHRSTLHKETRSSCSSVAVHPS